MTTTEQQLLRTVVYNGVPITYRLEQKAVKNLNLRICGDGSIAASANRRVSPEQVDDFVRRKGAAILAAQKRMETRIQNRLQAKKQAEERQTPLLEREEFARVLEEVYPALVPYGVAKPVLRLRDMTSRWGSCLVKKGIVTMNTRLLAAPRECMEYVMMHELCHFIHPNHSKQFYDLLTLLMPDWKRRKDLLNQSGAIWD